MDETYIKVKGVWKYLYRAVDKEGKKIDFLLTAKRDKAAAMRFFEKAIQDNARLNFKGASPVVPSVITRNSAASKLISF